MGGFFSSNKSRPPPSAPVRSTPSASHYSRPSNAEPSRPSVSPSYRYSTPEPSRPAPSSYATAANRPRQSYTQETRTQPPQRRIEKLVPTGVPWLIHSVFGQEETDNWRTNTWIVGTTFRLVTMTENEEDYWEAHKAFRSTTQKQLKIVSIKRVENPYLLGCYLLKRDEIENRHGFVEEKLLFHGTKQCNVNSICENNFDWRLHGDSRGNIFGKGVSFSPIANYSSHYCDNTGYDTVNAMFLARVLLSDQVVGNRHMELPDESYDTAIKPGGHVIVKFCDNEFYPEFVIYYTGCAFPNNHIRC